MMFAGAAGAVVAKRVIAAEPFRFHSAHIVRAVSDAQIAEYRRQVVAYVDSHIHAFNDISRRTGGRFMDMPALGYRTDKDGVTTVTYRRRP